MRRVALGFVFGAWLLQQLAVLPALYWAFLFLIPSLFHFFVSNFKLLYLRHLKTLNILFCACLAGFFWAATFATVRLSDELPKQWQQKNIKLIGVIATLPELNERGERFGFDVEKVFPAGSVLVSGKPVNSKSLGAQLNSESNVKLHVPRHISLNFYRESNRKNAVFSTQLSNTGDHSITDNLPSSKSTNNQLISNKPASNQSNLTSLFKTSQFKTSQFKVGERWQFNVRLKRPHSSYNPHGFDFEAWALSENVRATGNIHQKSGYKKLSEFVWRPTYMVQKVREKIGNQISQTLANKPYAGVIRALVIGDDSQIDSKIWNVYLNTGTNHLMSISYLLKHQFQHNFYNFLIR